MISQLNLRDRPTVKVLVAIGCAIFAAAVWVSRSPAASGVKAQTASGVDGGNGRKVAGTSPASEGDALISQAIDTLEQIPSVVAQIKHESRMFDQLLVGDGMYQQLNHPDGVMTRLELTVQTDNEVTTLRHISNGQFLYMQEQRGNEQSVRRVDLRTVRRSQSTVTAATLASSQINRVTQTASPSMARSIAIGGLPRLLAELQKNFRFRNPQAISFQNVPVWAVAGEWKPERLQIMFPAVKGIVNANGVANIEKIPEYVPDRVFILLGRDRLFPYRIEYRKDTLSTNVSPPVALSASASDALLTMDLYRVQIGTHPDLEMREFRYQPDDHQKVEDYTSRFLKTLR